MIAQAPQSNTACVGDEVIYFDDHGNMIGSVHKFVAWGFWYDGEIPRLCMTFDAVTA